MTSIIFPPAEYDLSIIIVNWNTRDLLTECLGSIFTISHNISFEVIVVDSASDDGSPAMVRHNFPRVELVESEVNLGFAGGNNAAIGIATGHYLLLLNPDTVVHGQTLVNLYSALELYPVLGIVGAQLYNVDGSRQESYGIFPGMLTEIPLLNRLARMGNQPLLERELDPQTLLLPVDYVSGACLMTKREVLEEIGLLDEDFWLYTEETDLCYRARAAGWGVGSLPQTKVTHVARAASGQRFRKTMLFFYQSRVRFILKHHGHVRAGFIQNLTIGKAILWGRFPKRSPLYAAYGSKLSDEEIRSAYIDLRDAFSVPLSTLLATTWA